MKHTLATMFGVGTEYVLESDGAFLTATVLSGPVAREVKRVGADNFVDALSEMLTWMTRTVLAEVSAELS